VKVSMGECWRGEFEILNSIDIPRGNLQRLNRCGYIVTPSRGIPGRLSLTMSHTL
jgi:hypothetical protein